jgi:prophage regulatory protein
MQKRLKNAIFSGPSLVAQEELQSPAQKLQQLRQEMPHAGYIRQAGLLAMLPISSATLWRWVGKGDFPKPVKLSPRSTAWPIEAVQAWLAASGDESSPMRVTRNSATSLRTPPLPRI